MFWTKLTKYHRFGNALTSYLKVRQPRGIDKEEENWWKPKPRKKRSDQINKNTREKVISFFLSLEISRTVPNKKDVKCVEGEKKEQYIMTMTLSDAYELFKKKHTNEKIRL